MDETDREAPPARKPKARKPKRRKRRPAAKAAPDAVVGAKNTYPKRPGTGLIHLGAAERHELFAQEYMVDFNARRAYRAVYGLESPNPAVNGYRLVRTPDVARRIAELKQARMDRLHIEQDRPVRALLGIMEFDVADLFDEAGVPLPVREIPEETRRALAGVSVKVDPAGAAIVTYKFADKVRASEAMARILGVTADHAEGEKIVARKTIKLFGELEITF